MILSQKMLLSVFFRSMYSLSCFGLSCQLVALSPSRLPDYFSNYNSFFTNDDFSKMGASALVATSPACLSLLPGCVKAWRRRKSKSNNEPRGEKQHNPTEDHIHLLPNELILDIMDHLSGADTISLGATPRSFRSLSTPFSATTFGDHSDFANRFGQDIFSRSCLAERIGTLDARDELVCSCCRTTHERRKFSAHQQRREPEQRRCIAAPDAVALCSHINLRLDQISELLKNKGRVECVDCDSTASAGKVLVELSRTYFLMEAARGEPLDDMELAYAISSLPIEQICPHAQTTDIATRFPPDWIWLSSSHQYHQRTSGCPNEMYCSKCKPTGVSSKMDCDRCVFTSVFLTRKASESDPGVDIVSFVTSRSTDFSRKPCTVTMAWAILCEEPGHYCFSKEGYFG